MSTRNHACHLRQIGWTTSLKKLCYSILRGHVPMLAKHHNQPSAAGLSRSHTHTAASSRLVRLLASFAALLTPVASPAAVHHAAHKAETSHASHTASATKHERPASHSHTHGAANQPAQSIKISNRHNKTSPAERASTTHRDSRARRIKVSETATKEKPGARSGQTSATKHDDETVADKPTQDRVHAWYQSHGIVQANIAASKSSTRTVSETDTHPDTSVVPRKATVADFDRAAAKQSEGIRKAAEQAEHQTTEVDDAGAAEASGTSHIPRTAPTERVPPPFVHDDLPSAPVKDASPADRRLDTLAPVSRLTKTVHAPSSATDDEILSHMPLALPIATPKDTRAIAAEITGSPTPRLALPAPPVAPGLRGAPAIAAVKAGSRAPQLDPEVMDSMTAETFSGNTPADPRLASNLAIALASGKVSSTSTPGRKAPAQEGEETGAFQGSTSSPVNVNLYDGRGRLVMIPPMKGSHEILVHQNQMALSDGLDRIQDDDELAEMRRAKLLVSLPDNSAIGPDDRLPLNRRYARPWTVHFLQDLGRAHYARFGSPLIITSAARTVAFQRHLVRVNGNAAPPTGEVASPHLYGQAVDLGKHGMGVTEIAWMRAYLTPVEDAGKIDVEEEFQQSCFHISVYRRYLGAPARQPLPRMEQTPSRPALLQAKSTPAQKHHHIPTALLATRLP